MSTELRQLRGRVAIQERLTTSLSVSIEEIADQLQEITVMVATREDIKQLSESVEATREDIKQLSESVDGRFEQLSGSVDDRFEQLSGSVEATREDIKQFSESVDSRFEHVYGTLADLQANVVEVRNILATLLEKLEQK